MNGQQNALLAFDSKKSEAFSERLVGMFNEGALNLMISIGHRTGIFDAMADLRPATSVEIADEAGLNERYVREWLGAMTTGRLVEYEPEFDTYWLPPEHAAFLIRESGSDNLAVFAQYIAVLGAVEDDIVECFRSGGGVPYEKFKRFHEVMAEDSGQSVLPCLIDKILPLAPGLTQSLKKGIRVLDIGCGRGKAINLMAAEFPASRFLGFDLSSEAVAYARKEAENKGLENVRFEQKDVTDLEKTVDPEMFDLITTFDAIHDQAKPLAVLKGICTALKPDGFYLMQDIHGSCHLEKNADHPIGPLLYSISTMHCMTVSIAQGGEGLGTFWGRETAERLLREAGFRSIDIHQLSHDFQNDYYVISK
jgi:2-polyprenyl-3-methyl-5-hydroxy-6-metoxy-1,4-benzoquinol methylase